MDIQIVRLRLWVEFFNDPLGETCCVTAGNFLHKFRFRYLILVVNHFLLHQPIVK